MGASFVFLGVIAILGLLIVAIAVPAMQMARSERKAPTAPQQAGHEVTREGNVTRIKTQGNLAPTAAGIPGSVKEITPEHNPVNILLLARKKLDEGDTDSAAKAFLIARIYGVYDMMRVSDATAHQGMSVLVKEIFTGIEPTKEQALDTAIKGLNREETVQMAEEIGQPAYRPDYMIQHGVEAFTGLSGDGLVPGFNGNSAWQKILWDFAK